MPNNGQLARRHWLCAVLVVVLAGTSPLAAAQDASSSSGRPQLIIETSLGNVLVELRPDEAPRTVENLLRYVDAGHFTGGEFHRTVRPDNQPNDSVRIGVIQGRASPDHPGFAPIALERTRDTGLQHRDGTLSMARAGPDSATSSFFICIGDQPELDFGGRRNPDGQGFAAFGQVIEGMAVVRAIQAAPAEGQQLTPPIRILSIRRVEPGAPVTPPR